jgi:thiol-disulfide isomerase/thioredoxin
MRAEPSNTRRHVLRAAAVTLATGGLALAGVAERRFSQSNAISPGGSMSTPFLDDPLGRLAGGVRSLLHHPRDDNGRLPDEGALPPFSGATGWLNTDPLTPEALRGRVVLVDFWTYTCVNWLRTLPYVRAWVAKYAEHGLTVVGAHTPEFDFEHDVENIKAQARALRVPYPIAIDSDYGVWNAFGNHYWPAVYIADAQGRIRYHHFGEGEYAMQEMVIQQLLLEAGATDLDLDLVSVQPVGLEVAADYRTLRSPETYLGYDRASGLAAPDGLWADTSHDYTPPSGLGLNEWAPAGEWAISGRAATATSAGARLAFRFQARDVNLVMGPAERGAAVPFRVALDGRPVAEASGTDVAADGTGVVSEQRTYQLIRQLAPITERVFEIEFLEPGAELYCFTFG